MLVPAKKFLLVSLFVTSLCSADVDLRPYYAPMTEDTKRILSDIDRRIVTFDYAGKHQKYPVFVDYTRGPGEQVKTVLCGMHDPQTGYRGLVRGSADLQNLTALSTMLHLVPSGFKVVEEYAGYKDTLLGKTVERVLSTVLPLRQYKGQLLISEYNEELVIPMYWQLGSIKDFKALRTYLEKGIIAKDVKPLLLLQIARSGGDSLSADDVDFLNNYFTLLDPANELVKSFFKDAAQDLRDAQSRFKDAMTTGEKVGDLVRSPIKKMLGGYKVEQIAGDCLKESIKAITVTVILKKVIESNHAQDVTQYCQDRCPQLVKDTCDSIKGYVPQATTLAMSAAALVAAAMAYEATCAPAPSPY